MPRALPRWGSYDLVLGDLERGEHWQGTPDEFRKLHDYAIDAVRRALPTIWPK